MYTQRVNPSQLHPDAFRRFADQFGLSDASAFIQWFPVLQSLAIGWRFPRSERQRQFLDEIFGKQAASMKSSVWWLAFMEHVKNVEGPDSCRPYTRRAETEVVTNVAPDEAIDINERMKQIEAELGPDWQRWQDMDKERDSFR